MLGALGGQQQIHVQAAVARAGQYQPVKTSGHATCGHDGSGRYSRTGAHASAGRAYAQNGWRPAASKDA